jgi:predicted nucleotidyltransferase
MDSAAIDRLSLSREALEDFCRRWKIRELALFGSALRSDFRPTSDIDLLATFEPNAGWGLLAHLQMQSELENLLSRPVDLVNKRAIERSSNFLRRNAILSTAEVIYSADETHYVPR